MAQGTQNKPVVPVSEVSITDIEIEMDNFLRDARKLTNKAAASRARVTSINLDKLLKAYRYNSIKVSFKK